MTLAQAGVTLAVTRDSPLNPIKLAGSHVYSIFSGSMGECAFFGGDTCHLIDKNLLADCGSIKLKPTASAPKV